MLTQDQAEKASEWMRDNADKFGKAKAERTYLENFLKSKLALLMHDLPGDSVAAREALARAHPEYLEVLKGLREAVETEEALRWKMTAAQVRVDIWRTQEANSRRG